MATIRYDIYAIGVQECSYEVEVSTSREHWQDVLYKLFPKEVYTRLTCVDSWDRSLTIYVRNELECRIQQVETDTVNVGVGGMVGNKGAIGVKFSLYDTTFCFVNSHLAAHQYEVSVLRSYASLIFPHLPPSPPLRRVHMKGRQMMSVVTLTPTQRNNPILPLLYPFCLFYDMCICVCGCVCV